jgi:hypothetical protein
MRRSISAELRSTLLAIGIGIAGSAAGALSTAAQTPQPAPAPAPQHPQQQAQHPQKQKVTLAMLAAQGFEVKATIGSYLVVQRGKDVWLCYMLDTRSDCVVAE